MASAYNLDYAHLASEEPFSKWRRRLWPIHSHEIRKLLPLLLMKFCVSFNYSILHATKDTLIVTAKGSGAEAIPILKGWVVLFFAFILMLLYSKLSNHLSKSRLFYAAISPFLIFFALYGLFLYPNREWLCPHQTADWLVSVLGDERAHWVAVYRYWMDSLFFLMAELWGGVVIALLFWGFANRITTLHEAARFYTLLSAGGHIGMITAGPLIWHYAHAFVQNEYIHTIQYLMSFTTLVTILIMAIHWWVNRYVDDTEAAPSSNQPQQSKSQTKLSLVDSLKHILKSPYLGCIALMVIGYGLSVNMIEVIWKATLKIRYPHSNDYQAFMGIVSSLTGCVSLFLALFVGGNVIRKFGWHLGAQLTPVVLGIASAAFLLVYFLNLYSENAPLAAGSSALLLLVVFGAIHNIACKSMKYCLFDPTKEMAYIPLDEEAKVKGKAAVDVVASRFGKSGSSWLQVGFMELAGVGSVLSIVPYLAPCVIIAVISWMAAISILKKRSVQTQTATPLEELSLEVVAKSA
jgi:AAA family ATP:ADP antiporter